MAHVQAFLGTAEYYSRYRVPYPEELLNRLLRDAAVTGNGRLVDLGCGTGEIAVPLSRHFQEVLAVDVDPEMVRQARARARALGRDNIAWFVQRAEDFDAPPESAELVTVGSAFHWMDRPLVAQHSRRWLAPHRWLAILGSNSTWTGTAPWQAVARKVIQKWLGEQRRAGSGTFSTPVLPHEAIVAEAGFEEVREFKLSVPHTWTLDAFVGYLYSTSFASRAVLGSTVADFEADMRRALREHDPSDRYIEDILFYYILGRRPR